MPSSKKKSDLDFSDIEYWRPDDVPDNLSPIDRARIAARNVRAWADWSISSLPAPEQGDRLVDVGDKGVDG